MSKQQGNVQGAQIYACASPALTDLIKEGSEERRNASADHDGVRLQEIDDASEPVGQQLQSLAHYFFGDWIMEGMSPSHHFAAHSLKIAARHLPKDGIWILCKFLTCSAGDRGTRCQRFDAAAFPAIAKRSVDIDPQMPAFRGSASLPVKNAAIENNSCADSGAHGGVKDASIATARPPFRFGQRPGIGVGHKPYWTV